MSAWKRSHLDICIWEWTVWLLLRWFLIAPLGIGSRCPLSALSDPHPIMSFKGASARNSREPVLYWLKFQDADSSSQRKGEDRSLFACHCCYKYWATCSLPFYNFISVIIKLSSSWETESSSYHHGWIWCWPKTSDSLWNKILTLIWGGSEIHITTWQARQMKWHQQLFLISFVWDSMSLTSGELQLLFTGTELGLRDSTCRTHHSADVWWWRAHLVKVKAASVCLVHPCQLTKASEALTLVVKVLEQMPLNKCQWHACCLWGYVCMSARTACHKVLLKMWCNSELIWLSWAMDYPQVKIYGTISQTTG